MSRPVPRRRDFLLHALLCSAVASFSTLALAAPTPASVAKQLTAITQDAVKGRRVNYAVVAKKKAALEALVKDIGQTELKKASESERLAFYINAYNAHVLLAVLDAGLVKKGKPTGKGVLDVPGFFDKKKHTTAKKSTTLNALEEKFIRSEGDPRIHFAVNCASVDCPPLAPVAYTGRKLESALEAQTRAYLTRPGAVTFDDATKTVTVVKLFEWYAKDWGGDAGVRKFLRRYVDDKRVGTYKFAYREYDWRLNSTSN